MALIRNSVTYVVPADDDSIPDNELIEIFSRPIAKTIWAAYGQVHISGQDTNKKILDLATKLEEEGIPKNPKDLFSKMGDLLRNENEMEFAEELLPYLTGDRKFEYRGLSLC